MCMTEYEKLTDYAKRLGLQYRTVWNWSKEGKLETTSINGRLFVKKEEVIKQPDSDRIATYARVSSSENKKNLETQSARLYDYCIAKGYSINKQVQEVGSGINDNRAKLKSLLNDPNWDILVVEHKDRLTRFGFNYLEMLVQAQNRKIEVINKTEDKEEDLIQDFVSIITSFCSRLYGQRRGKRKTEKLIQELSTIKEG